MADEMEQDSTTTPPTEQEAQGDFSADYVKKLRQEAAANRLQAKKLQEQLATYEQAQMSEQQNLAAQLEVSKKQLETMTAQLRQERARAVISQAAAKANVSADLAIKLVDVQFDDDGNPLDVDKAIQELVKQYPNLAQQQPAVPQVATMRPGGGQRVAITKDDLKGKSPEWINANWDAVKDLLQSK